MHFTQGIRLKFDKQILQCSILIGSQCPMLYSLQYVLSITSSILDMNFGTVELLGMLSPPLYLQK